MNPHHFSRHSGTNSLAGFGRFVVDPELGHTTVKEQVLIFFFFWRLTFKANTTKK